MNATMALDVNDTMAMELPIDMTFNQGHVVSIVTYSVLMVVSIAGNMTVFVLILQRRRSNRSRINTMLLHLAVADLLVTLLMMPLEIGWASTVSWTAGDLMCRVMAFFRVFGIYLSSFTLVCISIDRYYAVLKPLQLMGVDRRGKLMLLGAWIGSIICSAPQVVIFHVEKHPNFTWYEQCVTYNVFPSQSHELTYSIFGMIMMYCLPLVVIIYTYSSILLEIYRKTKESTEDRIRRSSLGFLGRAKIRTLKMTIIIVVVFFICWTPYHIMCIWYWIDKDSARKVDQRIQKALFMFACTNSCMNPIVYGAFNIRRNTQGSSASRQIGAANKRRETTEEVVCRVSWRRTLSNSMQDSINLPCRITQDLNLGIGNKTPRINTKKQSKQQRTRKHQLQQQQQQHNLPYRLSNMSLLSILRTHFPNRWINKFHIPRKFKLDKKRNKIYRT